MSDKREKALLSISLGNQYPYDRLNGATRGRAHSTARGILADLLDRRNIKWALQDVDDDVRCEIVDAIEDIIIVAGEEDGDQ